MIKMKLGPVCLNCLFTKKMNKFPEGCSEEQQAEYMKAVMRIIGGSEEGDSAPVLDRRIMDLQEEMFGQVSVDYTEIKRFYNDLLMKKVPGIMDRMHAAEDPLKCAIQYAMTGNYIDFAALKSVTPEQLEELLEKAGAEVWDMPAYPEFCERLARAKRVVYVTDNCGEIVLDEILIRAIGEKYPEMDLTVMVRGADVVNDASMTDAEQIGLSRYAKVVGNGSRIAGTAWEYISDEARELLQAADLIIAKGQGNYETLHGTELPICFLFMCKCENFTSRFGVKKFDGIMAFE